MKRIKLNQTKDKTFEEGLQEYIENCKARNLREKTIIHYYESFKCIFKVIHIFNRKNVINRIVIFCIIQNRLFTKPSVIL